MHCASCVARVEKALSAVPGVVAVEVQLAANAARVELAEGAAVDPQILVERLGSAGFEGRLRPAQEPIRLSADDAASGAAWIKLAVGGLLGLALLLGHAWLNSVTAFALALAVHGLLGLPVYRRAAAALAHLSSTMDTLIGLGSLAALGYSLWLAAGGATAHELYLDTSALILVFHGLGRLLEARARARTTAAVAELLQLAPSTAEVLEGVDDEVGRETPLDRIVPGTLLRLRPGDRVPLDGEVLRGRSEVDESPLTGEALPVVRSAGDHVLAGTLNTTGALIVRVTAAGADTTLARIIRAVQRAQASRPPVQRLADRVSAVFVPAVLILAALTTLGWGLVGGGWDLALERGIAVLVVACPCALGLAVPVAIMVGVGRAAREGILIRDVSALEHLAALKAVLIDKTGTLTRGRPEIVAVEGAGDGRAGPVLRFAASLEQPSEHPFARAIVAHARAQQLALAAVEDFQAFPGEGVSGLVEGEETLAGTAAFLAARGVSGALGLPSEIAESRVYVARGGRWLGLLRLHDPLRQGLAETMMALRDLGAAVSLISGDHPAVVQDLARRLGLSEAYGGVSPLAKLAAVQTAQERWGRPVAMIGDGINDGPALAAADVGVALGTGTGVAIESAGMTLLRGDLRLLPRAIELSRATRRTLRQNLAWACLFNALGIPLAAAGALSPLIACAAMSISSVLVVLNALRLLRR